MKPNANHNHEKKIRIFLVEDEQDLSSTYKIGLEQNGFLVDVFNDPIQALMSFMSGTYDLLLLDIKMPNMNGFELHREIQRIDNKVKVCFITSFVVYYESLREIFNTRGMCCFINKPIEISRLAERIRAELGQ